ncbi:MAG: hypothetical protein MUO26_14105 [Methanotrichaceae archaeon]|nr:hypothetical protein [Methanotrichaceae archaeon]
MKIFVTYPRAHLLLGKEQFVAEMVDNGTSNAEVEDFSKRINRFRLSQYKNILGDLIENCNAF